jgi:hypothetical protein
MTSVLKDFIVSNDTNDDDFFNSYKPTFADPNFLDQPSMLRRNSSFNNYTSQHLHQKNNTTTTSSMFQPTPQGFQSHFVKTSFSQSPSHSYFFSQQSFSFSNYSNDLPEKNFKPKHSPIITINNEYNNTKNQPTSFLESELNNFQSFLDDFHSHLEESLSQIENINPQSKKISKPEKIFTPPLLKKKMQAKRFNDTPVSIYS